ncbi:MAG: hypothetical protein HY321_06740 [Armatimonadetes bacterium]|nr:hypothetical protein [Armatimonadota bacterium]
MLEYTLELEGKIAEGMLDAPNNAFVLALCGCGWYWRQDDLEDFVHFYRSSAHREDDPFSVMERHYISEKGIALTGTVSQFAYLRRPQWCIRPNCLIWSVQSPPQPWLRLAGPR